MVLRIFYAYQNVSHPTDDIDEDRAYYDTDVVFQLIRAC